MIIAEAQVLAGDPGGAITTVRAIPGGAARSADVGTFVAFAQAQSGDLAGALATAHAIMGFRRVFLNVWLAAYQAKAGDIAGALRTAEEVPASAMHGLYAVAAAQVTNGDMAGARATAQRITEPTMRDRTLAMLTGVLARTDVPAALGLAQSLADGEARDDAVRRVAVTQVQGGDAAAAITTAGSLGDSRARSTALLAVARAQAEGGDAAGAWATATTIPDKGLRGEAEKKVALALARAGAPARLIEVARRESGPYWRVIALAQGAGDIMKHTSELREPGFGALVPAELRPLF